MGIDSQMLMRIKGRPHLTQDQVRHLSWRVGEAFGSDRFMQKKYDDDDYPEGEWSRPAHHSLQIIEKYEQDGPTLEPEEGEQFIEVHLWTRFYGQGYTRGDGWFILNLAHWLEYNVPGVEIWYGGDSSGCCASKLDRDEMLRLLTQVGHTDYWMNQTAKAHGVVCGFCKVPMNQVGFGGKGSDYALYDCAGCGREIWREEGKWYTNEEINGWKRVRDTLRFKQKTELALEIDSPKEEDQRPKPCVEHDWLEVKRTPPLPKLENIVVIDNPARRRCKRCHKLEV